VRGAARTDDRQRDAVRGDRPDDVQPLPAQPRGAVDPAHPDPDRHALDERQIEAFWATLQAEVLDRQQLAGSRLATPTALADGRVLFFGGGLPASNQWPLEPVHWVEIFESSCMTSEADLRAAMATTATDIS
jgi:hypothetical protein